MTPSVVRTSFTCASKRRSRATIDSHRFCSSSLERAETACQPVHQARHVPILGIDVGRDLLEEEDQEILELDDEAMVLAEEGNRASPARAPFRDARRRCD